MLDTHTPCSRLGVCGCVCLALCLQIKQPPFTLCSLVVLCTSSLALHLRMTTGDVTQVPPSTSWLLLKFFFFLLQ